MKPIFIGGTGRSGTTILKRVLNCHSLIISMQDELRVIVDPDGALDLISVLSERWSPYNADIAIHRFRNLMLECTRSKHKTTILLNKLEKKIFRSLNISPRRYLGSGLANYFGRSYFYNRLDKLIHELSYYATPGSWAGSIPISLRSKIFETGLFKRKEICQIIACFFNDLYERKSESKNATYWLDDTPYNLLHALELLEVFPEMKFIHIYRDPRDIVASYQRFSWGGTKYTIIAKRLSCIYHRWFQIRKKLANDCVYEVGLESLASSPKLHLDKICRFIGVDFEEPLTSITLNKTHAGRWKQEIPEREWQMVKHDLLPYIEAYGFNID